MPARGRAEGPFQAGTRSQSRICVTLSTPGRYRSAAYIVERRSAASKSKLIVRRLRRRLTLESPSPQRVLEAAALKAQYPISYADAFAVATAIVGGCRLLTGDPEILAGDPAWPVDALR